MRAKEGRKEKGSSCSWGHSWFYCDGGWGEQSGPEDPLFGGGLCNRRSDSQGL